MRGRGIVFGKLPAHGDFVRRGLTPEMALLWDAAVSRSLASARAEFGDGFAQAYQVAPTWRFAIPFELAWLAGAIAPSVDMAGRLFPLIAAQRTESHGACGALAAHCESALFAAIRDRLDADMLLDLLDGHGPASHLPCPVGWWLEGDEPAVVREGTPFSAPDLIGTMLRMSEPA